MAPPTDRPSKGVEINITPLFASFVSFNRGVRQLRCSKRSFWTLRLNEMNDPRNSVNKYVACRTEGPVISSQGPAPEPPLPSAHKSCMTLPLKACGTAGTRCVSANNPSTGIQSLVPQKMLRRTKELALRLLHGGQPPNPAALTSRSRSRPELHGGQPPISRCRWSHGAPV